MTLLAQSAPDAVTTTAIIAAIVFLLGGVNQGMEFFRKLRAPEAQIISPQPLIVEMQKSFASTTDLHRVEAEGKAETAKLFAKLGGVERGLREENKEDTALINAKIDDVRKEVKEDINGVHQRITDVLTAVSRLEGQISGRSG